MGDNSSPLVKLARDTIALYLKSGQRLIPGQNIIEEFSSPSGTFVSIKKEGRLRGCIGTFGPTKENIAEEVVSNAISAATKDPRFPPITESELDGLDISVDVLTSPEKVKSKEELDPKRYGLIVKSGYRRGLLLPDLEGVNTVEEQISICRQKGGIDPYEPIELFRFEVVRHR